MTNPIDKLLIRFIKWRIHKGWGSCKNYKDWEDFPEITQGLNDKGRCGSCAADEVVEWLTTWEKML